jgi:hypothetical protein
MVLLPCRSLEFPRITQGLSAQARPQQLYPFANDQAELSIGRNPSSACLWITSSVLFRLASQMGGGCEREEASINLFSPVSLGHSKLGREKSVR